MWWWKRLNGWFGRHLGVVVSVCLSEETYFQPTSEVAVFGIKFTFASKEKLPPHTFVSQWRELFLNPLPAAFLWPKLLVSRLNHGQIFLNICVAQHHSKFDVDKRDWGTTNNEKWTLNWHLLPTWSDLVASFSQILGVWGLLGRRHYSGSGASVGVRSEFRNGFSWCEDLLKFSILTSTTGHRDWIVGDMIISQRLPDRVLTMMVFASESPPLLCA